MALPESDLAVIRSFCDAQNESFDTDKLRIEHETSANTVTLYEYRAPWSGDSTEWDREDFAQL